MYYIKKLLPGILLIILTSSILLLSDLNRRVRRKENVLFRIAINQFSSRPTLDDTAKGIISGLNEKGFIQGKNILLKRYNAENDLSTANAIASEITSGNYDMIITISTPSLQTTANANVKGKVIHIFSTVTDPAAAGVGISAEDPYDHPPHLAGIGTFQPVERVFKLIKQIKPDLMSVGVVWNPSEDSAQSCLKIARKICKELNIDLVEATVDSSRDVYEAAISLVQKNVQSLWIGGDNTVELAISSVVGAAQRGNIPVFTNNTDHPPEGAFLGLGANYFEVGKRTGEMAAKVINGLNPAKIPIEDVAPPKLIINLNALNGLKDNWYISDEILNMADKVIRKVP